MLLKSSSNGTRNLKLGHKQKDHKQTLVSEGQIMAANENAKEATVTSSGETEWSPQDTTRHQDHVIAHIQGATVLGYFILDEALFILLDMGFIWTIYLDGEMGLLQRAVAIEELEVGEDARKQIQAESDSLLNGSDQPLLHFIAAHSECTITEVSFFAAADRRRFIVSGEETDLIIETCLVTAEIEVYEDQ